MDQLTSPKLTHGVHCLSLRHKGMYVMSVPDPDESKFYLYHVQAGMKIWELYGLLDHRLCLPIVGHVQRQAQGFNAVGRRRRSGSSSGLLTHVRCDQAPALARQTEGNGASDPRPRSGHQRNVVSQSKLHSVPLGVA